MTALLLLLGRLWSSPIVRKALLVTGLAVAAVTVPWATYRTGLSRGSAKAHAEDAEHERAAVDDADAKYRAQERANDQRVSDLRVMYAKAEAAARASDAVVSRDLADGTRRVRIPVASCCPNATALGPAPGGVDGTETAELPGPIAAALYAIAADGDQAIRQLTALQDWSRSAVVLCGGKSGR